MMATRYDPDQIRAFYDAYGEREWERFDLGPANRVNLYMHRRYLEQYIRAGDHVLDVGAGPGRFTIELARLGATVTVADISPRQLELNRAKVREAGHESSVVDRIPVDVTDLSRFPPGRFDAVVCYGGPLSYVFEQADDALSELLRVTKSGGYILLSVMSLAGTLRRFLREALDLARDHGTDVLRQLIATGDQAGPLAEVAAGHRFHYYRWAELDRLLRRHPCTIAAATAANFLAIRNEAALQEIMADTDLWSAFLQWEVAVSQEPGALDGGTHIIAVVRHTAAG